MSRRRPHIRAPPNDSRLDIIFIKFKLRGNTT